MNIEPINGEFVTANAAAVVASAAGEVVPDPRSPIGIAKQVQLSDAYSRQDPQPKQNAAKDSGATPDRSLKMYVSKDEGLVIKVVNPRTDEVVREIPSEELQRLRAEVRRISGTLFDAKA